MLKPRNKFPDRNAKERMKDFIEVGMNIPLELALQEAERCLMCKNSPCVKGCPVNVKIPQFINALKQKNIQEAYNIIRQDNFLPSVCGRVCPQEVQCEKNCVLNNKKQPVAIGKLEKFTGDYAINNGYNQGLSVTSIYKKAAMIGSGPASLACAGELARNGVSVKIFEALHKEGGVLVYGIPEFRLPKSIVAKEINVLQKMGVEIIKDVVVGKTINIPELLNSFDAVFIGVGAGFPSFMNIPGEKLNGVLSSNEFLTRINLMNAYQFPNYDTPFLKSQNTVVVGGGNTAMDAARTALRIGVEKVTIVYRRTEVELPARIEEVHHAKEEGVEFEFLLSPVEIIPDQNRRVKKIICQKMELGESDEKGRRKPVPIKGALEEKDCDLVIMAIGTQANPLLALENKNLKINKWGYIEVNEKLQTSIPNVYAGGDIVTGSATVIKALGAGKKAAIHILASFDKK